MSQSVASISLAPSKVFIDAAQTSPAADWQSLAQVKRFAGLVRAVRSATAPSLPLGAFLPLPLPSARDQVVRVGNSRVGAC
jgi:hypothetical protein